MKKKDQQEELNKGINNVNIAMEKRDEGKQSKNDELNTDAKKYIYEQTIEEKPQQMPKKKNDPFLEPKNEDGQQKDIPKSDALPEPKIAKQVSKLELIHDEKPQNEKVISNENRIKDETIVPNDGEVPKSEALPEPKIADTVNKLEHIIQKEEKVNSEKHHSNENRIKDEAIVHNDGEVPKSDAKPEPKIAETINKLENIVEVHNKDEHIKHEENTKQEPNHHDEKEKDTKTIGSLFI